MSPAFRGAIALAMLGLAGSALPASAQTTADYSTKVVVPFFTTVDHFTTTTSAASPTFNRPGLVNVPGVTAPPTALSGGGTAVAYEAHDFTPTANGTYRITTTINSGYADPAASPNGTDNFVQALYLPGAGNVRGFDPTSPLTNAALAYSQGASGEGYFVNLGADTNYTLVNTGYYNASFTDPAHLSVGTATTDVDLEDFGSTQFIPDASTLGDPGVVSQTLHISDTGILDSFNSFSFVGLENDAIGDLTATLSHNGISINLFDRPDAPATGDNFGSLASFDAGQTYTFADSGADLGATARETVDAADPFSTYFPIAGGTYQSLDSLSAFFGTSLAGDWTLTVKDSENSAGGAYGDFLGFSFSATTETAPVPEASTFVSLGIGCGLFGLLLIKRRRGVSAQ